MPLGVRMHFALLLSLLCAPSIHASDRDQTDWLAPLNKTWKVQSPGKPYSFQRVNSPSRNGKDSLRFELRHGEVYDDGTSKTYRSEVATKTFVPKGSENWYGFSIYLPKEFPIENNRLVLAQWWAKTKEDLGEVHRSPVLQLRFADGNLGILLRLYSERIAKDPEAYKETKLYKIRKLPLEEWNDFIFHIKWSAQTDGLIEAWWQKKKVIDFHGITENPDDVGPTFKFGLYRDNTDKTYTSYVSNYKMGTSFEEVDPSR